VISDSRVEAAFEDAIKQRQEQGRQLDSKEREWLKADIGLQLKVLKVLEKIGRGAAEPNEQDIEKYYQDNAELFRTSEQVRVSHIVKHVDWQSDDTEAQDIINQAKEQLDGGASFESLVSRYSDCPDNGGDLGYISRGRMVEEFEDVVFNLGVGEVSGVFRSRYGFHIAKVYDQRPAVVKGLEQVKSEIKQELIQQSRDKAVEKLLDKLRAEAKIEYI
jgi:parvulin-like peptidyl-prolyl isomerase